MKQVSHGEPTDIRSHRTRFGRPDDLAPNLFTTAVGGGYSLNVFQGETRMQMSGARRRMDKIIQCRASLFIVFMVFMGAP